MDSHAIRLMTNCERCALAPIDCITDNGDRVCAKCMTEILTIEERKAG